MPLLNPSTLFDAARMSTARSAFPTALDSAGLRELGGQVLGRSVFCAHGASVEFAARLREIIDQLTSDQIGETQAKSAIRKLLDTLGYTPERGFPDAIGEVPPAVRGSLQDLSSLRRLDLIVRTQLDLMRGAGDQWRGHQPVELERFPAWELVRYESRRMPRDWFSRWMIAGGKLIDGRMIALKGDPIWGELGSSGNFDDALDVDYPPFAFQSGMGWRAVSRRACETLVVLGPNDVSIAEWFDSRPETLAGTLNLPAPQISLADVPKDLIEDFQVQTGAVPDAAKPDTMVLPRKQDGSLDFTDLLDKAKARRAASRAARKGAA